jgi:hypothetical protein
MGKLHHCCDERGDVSIIIVKDCLVRVLFMMGFYYTEILTNNS